MGTGAVYLTLSNLKYHPGFITHIERVFFGLNIFCEAPQSTSSCIPLSVADAFCHLVIFLLNPVFFVNTTVRFMT